MGYILVKDQPLYDSFLVGLDKQHHPSVYCTISYSSIFQLKELYEFLDNMRRLIDYNKYNENYAITINLNDVKWWVIAKEGYILMKMRYLNTADWLEMLMGLDEAELFLNCIEELLAELEANPYTINARNTYKI